MNEDFIILKAQFHALRNYFTSLLPTIFRHDKEMDSKVWLAKYLLWKFERDNLAPYDLEGSHKSPDQGKIGRRRFQLQVLMDVAYIQGQLEGYGIPRLVGSYDAVQAQRVFENSDGSEETMLPLIDALYDD
ncbi:MAG: hypothetical protein IJ692_06385 [Alloprevotella sp.]|nr:hypothetical protein [Alloprevotella sp.]